MKGISLCMIVKDEEEYLENCLKSVEGLVDDIIIVDTGSKDSTKEIAKKFTEKIFDFNWEDDFSDARNFSISKASREWILILDADETISKKDHSKIKELIEEDKCDAIIFDLRDYTNKTGYAGVISAKGDDYDESKVATGFHISKLLRLFKNDKGYFFEGKIHETPYKSIENKKGIIIESEIVIHHFGNLNQERFLNKRGRNAELLMQRLKNRDFGEKTKDRIYFELGRELINLKRFDDAINYFEQAVDLKEDFEYLLGLGGLYLLKKRFFDSEKILKKAVLLNPQSSSAHDNLGVIYAQTGEFNKAIRRFEKALALNPKSADVYYNLGLVYKQKGKLHKMKENFNKAIELNPAYKNKIQGG